MTQNFEAVWRQGVSYADNPGDAEEFTNLLATDQHIKRP